MAGHEKEEGVVYLNTLEHLSTSFFTISPSFFRAESHKSINHRVVLTDFSRRRWTCKATSRRRLEEDGAASISRFDSVSGFLDLMRTNSFQALWVILKDFELSPFDSSRKIGKSGKFEVPASLDIAYYIKAKCC
jgi:hypothetical protein